MKSHDGCICVCHWLGLLQPSFSTLKVILLLHSSLMISRTNCFLQNSLVTWLSHCCGPTEHLMNLSPHIAVAPALHISKTSTPPCNFLLKSLDTSEWGREQSLWVLTAVWDILGWTHTQRWCYIEPSSFGEWRLWIRGPSTPIFWAGTLEVPRKCCSQYPWTG